MIAPAAEAEARLEFAENLLAAAEATYRREPSSEHLSDLEAAVKLVDESRAQAEEWTV